MGHILGDGALMQDRALEHKAVERSSSFRTSALMWLAIR